VYTDKYGVIISFNQDTSAFSKDLLNEFAGLKPFYYTIGTVIDFFSSFSIPAFAKGTVWKDYTNIAGEKAVADCNLYHLDDTSAGIKYSETITGKFANTNTNGAEIIARSTGIVKERVLQSRTSAYKLINNALIIVNKSIAIKEKFILRTAE
jgi:hypothetical protein